MSKNKNPLKDLDLFLKQQAASFVNPTTLREKIEAESPAALKSLGEPETKESILQSLERMMDQNPEALYDLLIKAAEKKTSVERTLLINTALYLKNTDNWREAVREYWENRN